MIEIILKILGWLLVVAGVLIVIVIVVSAISYLHYLRSMRHVPRKRDDDDE